MKKFVKRAISQVIALALAFQIVGQCIMSPLSRHK